MYFSPELGSSADGGRLNFLNFETERIDLCIEFLKQLKENHRKLNGSAPGPLYIMATGGGAYKYYDRLKEELGVDIIREDEMECLIIGMIAVRNLLMVLLSLTSRRPRFLYHRDTERSLHLQRRSTDGVLRSSIRCIPLPPREHRIRSFNGQSVSTKAL